MTIDKLADNRVLIVLCKQDMSDFSLDYSKMKFDDGHSRKVLMRILRLACMKEGIEINGKSVLLEAINFDEECYLLVTINSHRHKRYRLKSNKNSLCYHLGGSGNFLDTIEQLYRQNVCCNHNSAYMYNNEYYLIFDYPSIPHKLKRVLSEYGNKGKNSLSAARVKENGKQLCRNNAIAQIGKFLV
ncbi:MAG: adaptor protein MecA [Ruminococcus sp.]|nr:adaptor protein MecA [Ruminococcus sp.]